MAPKLLNLTQAAAALDPHVAPISAINVLNDWRRSKQHYKPLSNSALFSYRRARVLYGRINCPHHRRCSDIQGEAKGGVTCRSCG